MIYRLQKLFEFRREDSPDEKLGKLERVMEQYNFSLEETVPLFASFLSTPLQDRYPPLNMTPQKQKQSTLEGLLTWLLKETESKPVLYIVEDLHWADPSTLEFLSAPTETSRTGPTRTKRFAPIATRSPTRPTSSRWPSDIMTTTSGASIHTPSRWGTWPGRG